MLIPNTRFILHDNHVSMVEILKYKGILTYDAKHFDTAIRNDWFDDTPKCSFWRALIWYKILCDTIISFKL